MTSQPTTPTTLVNVISCKREDQAQLLQLLRENTDTVITTLDGWHSTRLIGSTDGTRIVIVSEWRDAAAVAAMQGDARMQAYYPRIAALASFDSTAGSVAYDRRA